MVTQQLVKCQCKGCCVPGPACPIDADAEDLLCTVCREAKSSHCHIDMARQFSKADFEAFMSRFREESRKRYGRS